MIFSALTTLTLVGIMFFFILTLIRHFDRLGNYKIIIILPSFGLIQIIINSFLPLFELGKELDDIILTLYILLEFAVLSYILISLHKSIFYKRILIFTSVLIFTICVIGLINNKNFLIEHITEFTILSTFIFITQALFLIMTYVFDNTIKDLNYSSEFFSSLAIFELFTYTFPINIFLYYILTDPSKYTFISVSTNDLGYIIFYLLFIKSIKCKIQQTK